MPPHVHFTGGYELALRQAQMVQNGGKGAMFPFTRQFLHPGDNAQSVSAEAVQAFWVGGAQFPEGAYEPLSRLWKGDQWRLPDSEERTQMHGLPSGCVAGAAEEMPWAEQERVRCSLIGDGFHLPSIMLFLFMLLQLVQPSVSLRCMYEPEERALRSRVQYTVWRPGILQD